MSLQLKSGRVCFAPQGSQIIVLYAAVQYVNSVTAVDLGLHVLFASSWEAHDDSRLCRRFIIMWMDSKRFPDDLLCCWTRDKSDNR